MAATDVKRKLAAILSADVAGYSRLVEADEEGTVARLKALRRDLIDPAIGRHHGRIVKAMGDGLLVEFPSVVEAVRSAVAVQRAMAEAEAGRPEDRRLRFRIGINLGDVIVEEGDIFGDGVNVAARLQELSEAGGICASHAARDQVGDRAEVEFEDLGERSVKNIARPIRVYRVRLEGAKAAERAIAGPVSDKPSIAVLPFVNMSGDPEQDYFADGLTEDIIGELSRFKDLFVISRTSTFAYKGKAVKVRDVAKDLGVLYVVEGSVRKVAKRVRVSVQLIDAETERHLWAERYDRQLEDIFAIQDEVTAAIVAILPGRVEAAARERAKRKPTENMAAYEYVLAGKLLHHRSTRADNAEALRMLDRAIELDPKYAHAHAWKACTLGQAWMHGYSEDREAIWNQVVGELRTALALDDTDSDVHRILAAVHLTRDDHDMAMHHQDRALALNPNDDLIVVQQGEFLTWLGRPEEGVEWIRKAMRLNPYHPERFWSHLGRAYFVARRYDEAIDAFKRIGAPDHSHHAFLAACFAHKGDAGQAAAHAEQVLQREPKFTVPAYMATQHYKRASDREHHREGLLKAGLA